jgi:hypothetical protein
MASKQRQVSKRNRTAPAGGAKGAAGGGGDGDAAATAAAAIVGPGQHVVLYRFNEGYTNAVKRPLRLGDLL